MKITVFLHTCWSKTLKSLWFYIFAQTKHRFLFGFVGLFCRNHRVFLDICDTVRQGKNENNNNHPGGQQVRKSSNSNSVAFHSGLGEKDTHNASVVGTMLNTIRERDRKLGWLAWRKTLKKPVVLHTC